MNTLVATIALLLVVAPAAAQTAAKPRPNAGRPASKSEDPRAMLRAFEDDQRFVTFQQEIAEADRVISESQTPEELPFDMTAELYIRGADRLSVEYRRWLFEVARASVDG